MAAPGSSDDTLVVYYDFKSAPVTFDFMHFIIAAHSYAVLNKLGRFDVVLIADAWRNASDRDRSYSLSERFWRLWNLIMEVLAVVPDIRNISILSEPLSAVATNAYPQDFHPNINQQIIYDPNRVIEFHSAGVSVQILRPSEYAMSRVAKYLPKTEQKVITFSLRKADYDSIRDSRLEDWYQFSLELKKRGYRVIVVPDQDDTLTLRTMNRYDWEVFEPSCMSVDLRLALYHRADMNYVTNGGMITLFLYCGVPFKWYSVVVEGADTASVEYYKVMGLAEGDKYPWLKENQHMIWEPDSLENLMKSIPELEKL